MGANPGGGGGGGGGRVPPFFQVGGHNSNVPPPPPPRFGGRMNFGSYIMYFVAFFFVAFFLLVRNVCDVGWVPLHILTCATFDADGAPEKKSVGVPPPPPHQLFWDLRYLWGWRRSGKMCLPPPTIRFGFAPLPTAIKKGLFNFLAWFDVTAPVSMSLAKGCAQAPNGKTSVCSGAGADPGGGGGGGGHSHIMSHRYVPLWRPPFSVFPSRSHDMRFYLTAPRFASDSLPRLYEKQCAHAHSPAQPVARDRSLPSLCDSPPQPLALQLSQLSGCRRRPDPGPTPRA